MIKITSNKNGEIIPINIKIRYIMGNIKYQQCVIKHIGNTHTSNVNGR